MSGFEFSDLKNLVNALYDPYFLPSNEKIKLAELLEDVLELKGKKSPEEAIATLKDKIRNGLKNEIKSEMKQKINKFEQLEKENTELKTKKDQAERLNRALEHANNTAQNENTELKNKLNIQIQQFKKESKSKNKTIEQLTYTATIGASLAVGLIVYIALEHITGLSMVAIISIAAASALVAGYVTHTTLRPNTQVNESKEVQINCKRQNLISTSHIHLTEC
ncbi:hypothetical protein Wcon_00106 [Wolbachia endosymbiont of Cylisticus convexus]|uniref:hypothetical protein n=1 Tax=Wolbachia endosymbiont of Cylisticus convexus TaxID=118728 RepID=UPI000DF6C1A8|nr:hypothetical protein [Wolbachia endosymbiont of Cylisticus convexus]RDD35691.1 hypothetical protein Wcon_00106 [Wolbachia endosymbiont of Cylisticus convexus]